MSSIAGFGLVLPGALGADAGGIRIDQPAWGELTLFEPPAGCPAVAGEAPEYSLKDLGVSVKSYLDRTTSLALAAAALALAGQRDEHTGLSFASRWGCLASMRLFYGKVRENPRVAPPLPFSHSYVNSPAAVLAIEFALRGFHAVYSHGKQCALSALVAAVQHTDASGEPVLVVAADALSPERLALYQAKGVLGTPAPEAPARAVPSEGAVAVLVRRDAAGARIAGWSRPGPAGRDKPAALADAISHSLHLVASDLQPSAFSLQSLPVCTDAATFAAAAEYEEALAGHRFMHLGLALGEAEAALPLAAAAYAAHAGENVLCIAGGLSEPVAVLISPVG